MTLFRCHKPYSIGCPGLHLHFSLFLSFIVNELERCMAFHSISTVVIRHSHYTFSISTKRSCSHTSNPVSIVHTVRKCVYSKFINRIILFHFFFFRNNWFEFHAFFPLLPQEKKIYILFGKKQTERICLLFAVCLLVKSTPWCRRLVDYTHCVCFVCAERVAVLATVQRNGNERERKWWYFQGWRDTRSLTDETQTGTRAPKYRWIEERFIYFWRKHIFFRVLFQFCARKKIWAIRFVVMEHRIVRLHLLK